MPASSTIALIIMVITIVLYATEKIPLAVTALLSMLAMAYTGCISYSEAFSGFSNTATLMIVGAGIISEAVFTTGLADRIGQFIMSMDRLTEKRFVLAAVVISALLSAVINAMIVMALFMPIISAISDKTEGRITRKNTYLPIAIAAVFGGNLAVIGSSSMLNASAMLGQSYYGRPLDFFQPLPLALPGVAVCFIMFGLTGCRLQKKIFDFPVTREAVLPENKKPEESPVWKQVFVVVDLAVCIIAFIMGGNFGAVALTGGCLAIVSGCIKMDEAIRGVNWNTVLILVGTLGFAKGVESSGAGQVIADVMLDVCGPLGRSPYAMCVVMLVLGTVISNFMSNNATVGILVPVALSLCTVMEIDPANYVLACAIGANLSVMTPICTATITMTAAAGYRFKDYVRFGGLFNVLALIATALVMRLCF